MAIFPVVMCGGGGTRLWPTSRPALPKQFIPLIGETSLFQETILRVAPLVRSGGRMIVIAGAGHLHHIQAQLAVINEAALILLEPGARNSAAAMAAAAAWIARADPDGIAAFVASDHQIGDATAFQAAIVEAVETALRGRIVTLGVRPTAPSSAYGYIQPSGPGLSEVVRFVEKPAQAEAQTYLDSGYVWNSGNFIVAARTLMAELEVHAPMIADLASRALPEDDGGSVQHLSETFLAMPKISIDYAVMEKSAVLSVLQVDFRWSDLGAWDSVAEAGAGQVGPTTIENSDGCLVRSIDGVMVAVVGVSNLAVIVERDAVLVCALDSAQAVKTVVDRLKVEAPEYVDFHGLGPEQLETAGPRLAEWMRMQALPLWSTLGLAGNGLFAETLGLDGRPTGQPVRARVQARQLYCYARAGGLGWKGPWKTVVERGLEAFLRDFGRDDGRVRTLVSVDGVALDDTAVMYDQAFLLFALAAARQAEIAGDWQARAVTVREALMALWPESGGLTETMGHPFQSNPHMHLLEACLAWEDVSEDPVWGELADRIVRLAREHFIDAEGGFLREFFAEDWSPAPGADGRLVEPGHQFEWAWLMARYGHRRGDTNAIAAAERLYVAGKRGVDPVYGVALDATDQGGDRLSDRARLWPQTEWLKASLVLAEFSDARGAEAYLADGARALAALNRYLTPSGLWRDKMTGGVFIDEPAPASSFYHIMAAFEQLRATTGRLGIVDIQIS